MGRKWSEVKAELVNRPGFDQGAFDEEYTLAELRHRFGAVIREAREHAGLSQVVLAGKLGMTQSEVSRLELGGVDPRLSTLVRLAAVLGPLEVHPDGARQRNPWTLSGEPAIRREMLFRAAQGADDSTMPSGTPPKSFGSLSPDRRAR